MYSAPAADDPTPNDPIRQAIEQRRLALGAEPGDDGDGNNDAAVASTAGDQRAIPPDAPVWGLALSSGGLRSTSFSLGLMSALAREKLLLRFDLLSSVAAGGYAAAFFGMLANRARDSQELRQAETMLAELPDSKLAEEVRQKGRYLSPVNLSEAAQGIGLYLRNLITTHLELGAMAVALGVALTAFDVLAWGLLVAVGFTGNATFFELARYVPEWLPAPYLLLLPLACLTTILSVAYWVVPMLHRSRAERRWIIASITAALLAFLAATVIHHGQSAIIATAVGQATRSLWMSVAFASLACWILGLALAWRLPGQGSGRGSVPGRMDAHERHTPGRAGKKMPKATAIDLAIEQKRSRLSSWSSHALMAAGVVLLLGLIDRVAWYLAFGVAPSEQIRTGVALALLVATGQALLPLLTTPISLISTRWLLHWLASLLGYALLFLTTAWWVSLVQKAALGAAFQRYSPAFGDAWIVLAMMGAIALAYLTLSGPGVRFLNLSSLHLYYRAQLVRGYLAPTTPAFKSRATGQARNEAEPGRLDSDTSMPFYQPQRHGGPIHILNVCVNRRRSIHPTHSSQLPGGTPLRVASSGLLGLGTRPWVEAMPGGRLARMSLGSWMTISGTAVAPTLTGATSRGHFALAKLTGLRQGFWLKNNELLESFTPKPRGARKRVSRACWEKLSSAFHDTFGTARLDESANWYLSNGSHVDGTGAYALLAERAPVIVLVDGSSDPHREYRELENLIRRARLDLKVTVEFLRPRARNTAADPTQAPDLSAFGSLEQLSPTADGRCFALARTLFSADGTLGAASGSEGLLLLIKPNIAGGVPMDLANAMERNPKFPHDAGSDPWFAESQWDSYFNLGRFLGSKLSSSLLEQLQTSWRDYFELDTELRLRTSQVAAGAAASSPVSPAGPPAHPIRRTAVSLSLGLGASAAVGLALAQGFSNARDEARTASGEEQAALAALTEKWAKLPAQVPPSSKGGTAPAQDGGGNGGNATSELAAAILRTADKICNEGQSAWIQTSPIARRIYRDAIHACRRTGDQQTASCKALVEASQSALQSGFPMCLWLPFEDVANGGPPPRYWAFDYRFDAPYAHAHPCDPVARERRRAAARAARAPGDAVEAAIRTATIAGDRTDPAEDECSANWELRHLVLMLAGLKGLRAPDEDGNKNKGECHNKAIYIQTYGAHQEALVKDLAKRWRERGAFVPPALDVDAASQAANRLAPLPVATTTVRYHQEGDRACADALVRGVGDPPWTTEPLSQRQSKVPNLIEVWISPSQVETCRDQGFRRPDGTSTPPCPPATNAIAASAVAVKVGP